jgi:hypothetical protein
MRAISGPPAPPSTTNTPNPRGSRGDRTTAVRGSASRAVPASVASGTLSEATMPARSLPSGLAMVASTSKTRLRRSAEGAMRVILPDSSPGTASRLIGKSPPSASLSTSVSGAPKTTLTELVSASTKPAEPGATSEPTSTLRLSTTPSSGARRAVSARASFASLMRARAPSTRAAAAARRAPAFSTSACGTAFVATSFAARP